MTVTAARVLTVVAIFAAFGAGLAASLWLAPAPEPAPPVARMSAAPLTELAPLAFTDQWGREQRSDDWRGRLVVLNFWATWCPPCIHEIPAFVDLQTEYGDERVRFAGIAINEPEEAHAFAEELGMNYPTMADPVAPLGMMRDYGNASGGLPFTVFIDADGAIVHRHAGALTRDDAAAIIDGILAGR